MSEHYVQNFLKLMMRKNKLVTSLIGKGFHGTHTPIPIRRYVLENPKWYTPYSPYQAEISQGRLECLNHYQTMIKNITGLSISNASLLDNGSTAAEVLSMSSGYTKHRRSLFYASKNMHPYILDILKTKAWAMDIDLRIDDPDSFNINENTIGVMMQYPDTYGFCNGVSQDIIRETREKGGVVSCNTDLMALTHLKSPAELDFQIAFGTAQRFGVPMYFGGPHAAFLAAESDFLRLMPGRIVGKTKDATGDECYRLALQSREQHIRKDKATSNICTSQALLANISTLYAIYHGESGILDISKKIKENTKFLKDELEDLGYCIINSKSYFDTLTIYHKNAFNIYTKLKDNNYIGFWNKSAPDHLSLTLDETTTKVDLNNILEIMQQITPVHLTKHTPEIHNEEDDTMNRETPYLEDSIFNTINQNETKFMRYVYSLADKDYGLSSGMIPLGSCTMKENSAYQLEPLSWEEVANCHPFLPPDCVEGYYELIVKTGNYLKNVTGFDYCSFQSNSGAMGEYSALLCMRKYHGDKHKTVVIPESAHGTNFASASLAGLKVVKFRDELFRDLVQFKAFIEKHGEDLVGMMITYPNTNGLFQKDIEKINRIIHDYDGIVYLDGANMNALAGLIKPSDIGADVCHLNLHKTFCIPHGGGGPGMGPILCNEKLAKYLPTNNLQISNDFYYQESIGSITSSMWSSASLLTIPFSHFMKQGETGIKTCTKQAIKSANYMKEKLLPYYNIVGGEEEVAHEFIIDVSNIKAVSDVDISKRLIDYNFHPPTMSWPIKSSLMIEPTESESKEEIDRFIEAMISIRREIEENPALLKNAPHPIKLIQKEWTFPYSMEEAFFPVENLKARKHWPNCARVDDLYGDKLMYKKE